jgi:type VI secretion system protein ImpA
MPIREDIFEPIPGENPSGKNLRYDGIFEQLKEARFEEEDLLPEGDWERSKKKKADHRAVVRIAGDTLAKRSKDLQLVNFYADSLVRLEGFPVLAPAIDLVHRLQEAFWPTIFPVPDEDGDYEMRSIVAGKAVRAIAEAVQRIPITAAGFSYVEYLESRAVGFEKDLTTDARRQDRQYAINHGKLTGEDFDKAFAASPKKLYSEALEALDQALEALNLLNEYQRQAYNDNEPNLGDARSKIDAVRTVVEYLLNERRKTEPDPVAAPEPAAVGEGEPGEGGEGEQQPVGRPSAGIIQPRSSAGAPTCSDDAYAQVVESALFLFDRNPQSPVPYLICAGLRTGETAMQGEQPAPGFAVAPGAEVRSLLRNLALGSNWARLLRESLPVLASECARGWLDLHRYIWQAGEGTGAQALTKAVEGTVKGLLAACPQLRHWTLEDDTGAANPETQKWLDRI